MILFKRRSPEKIPSHQGIPFPHRPYFQLLSPQRLSAYLVNTAQWGFNPWTVSGYFLPASQLGPSPQLDRVVKVFAHNYRHADGQTRPFVHHDGCLYALRFACDTDATQQVVASSPQELKGDTPPSSIPQFISWRCASEPVELLPGARIERICPDGTVTVVSVYTLQINGQRTWEGHPPPRAYSEIVPPAFHRTFAKVDGLHPVFPLDRRRLFTVGSDRRALRLRLGTYADHIGVHGDTAWAVLDRTHCPQAWATTRGTVRGLPVTVSRRHSDASRSVLDVTYIGPWAEQLPILGFWGDEGAGFHATLPEAMVEDVETSVAWEEPKKGGSTAQIDPPHQGTNTPRWHREFVRMPWGAIVPTRSEDERLLAWAPDERAADLMFPGHNGIVAHFGTGVNVDVTTTRGELCEAVTRTTLFDNPNLECYLLGEGYRSGLHPGSLQAMFYTWRPPEPDAGFPFVHAIAPQHVGLQEDELVPPGTFGDKDS